MKNNLCAGFAVLALSFTSLTGCNGGIDLYVEDTVTHQKIQVQEDVFTQDVLLSEVSDDYLAGLAHHYLKHGGDAALEAVITYDPRSYRNTAMHATGHAADVVASLRDHGVFNAKGSILPVKDQGDVAHLLVRYDMYVARVANDCDVPMPGMNGTTVHDEKDYKLGCGIQGQIVRQIARPSDLLGRGAQGGAIDGRGPVNVLDTYRSGAENEPLGGESASGE